ncbi:Inorganic pyrophosphatase TTM1 [Camellia lanceoleosa]|uniref:Inorganic pyrophosphatase TTM1 n=1 Tax=Camellia lanceoleosa TaxID=1840588 RepID=A0ACC0GWV1_9ERIC|nr:Inorganic pyrophosphatase TTM1 [Camellia lanceoleosa]
MDKFSLTEAVNGSLSSYYRNGRNGMRNIFLHHMYLQQLVMESFGKEFDLDGNRVQGKDRLLVKCVAEQLELEGSYVPRTYIEQIQLEKLVDEVMALPDDLKTKLSMDDDLVVASPKEALS